ncbi:fibronectin type III domain-containing protein, partial [Piscibacillus halophilus]|uniref:fibronectin type III domain-containing protein n=1 Tax=Piscibacillus halophilus TaxID=571933 RepID=UPI0024094C90
VWAGYPSEKTLSTDGKNIPKNVFGNLMTHMSQGVETADFERPDSVVEVGIEKGSRPAKLPSDYTPSDQIVTELFVKGTEPTEVSEQFDQLDPVNNLSAEFDEERGVIEVSWDHPKDDDDINYRVRVSVDGSEMQDVTTLDETLIVFDEISPDTSYTFEVTAITDDNESEPAQTSIETPKEEDEEESDPLDDFLDEDEDEQEDNQGNPGNGNGNGNGNDGGNQDNEEGNQDEEENEEGEEDQNEEDEESDSDDNDNGDGEENEEEGSTLNDVINQED